MPTIILHITNDDPILGEIDELPSPTDNLIVVRNPRRKDGKDIIYLDVDVTTVIWPVIRISFIEIMPVKSDEKVISSVRE
jgi:hypothetical protein